jgi:hypothetical protein
MCSGNLFYFFKFVDPIDFVAYSMVFHSRQIFHNLNLTMLTVLYLVFIFLPCHYKNNYYHGSKLIMLSHNADTYILLHKLTGMYMCAVWKNK